MRPSDLGFTLIELLIAIVILALTTLMLVEGVRMVATRVGVQEAGLDQASTVIAVDDFLRAELADTRPFPTVGGIVSFDGQPDSVAFVSVAPASISGGGLLNLSLAAMPTTNGSRALQLSWHPYRAAPPPQAAGSARLLLDHLREIRFAYFGPTKNGDPPQWQDTWVGMPFLPMLIRLQTTRADGAALPDLVVGLRLYPGSSDLRNARRRF
jgi:general secretion pathway protein J